MKFLCDKCKTRYSIGDDRVRGKILKIRCKNCANVITVREGMAEPEAADAADRARRPSSGGAGSSIVPAAAQGALGAAFASQLTKPPPALEEEWYVSIDGNQQGPFSLTDAQKWVAGKPFEAELHCWSEGFDDWLPVDKVSHFRNLRKKPEPRRAPTMPPPIPKVPARGDEPKPLFAATMASIEKAAEKPKPGVPHSIGTAPTIKAPTTPMQAKAKANGTGAANSLPVSAGAAALAAAFKHDDAADQMTAVEAPAFHDEVATTAEPHASRRLERMDAKAPALPMMDEDDNLEIGEVSRVVKLADIAAMSRPKPASTQPPNRQSAPNLARTGLTGAQPRIGNTASFQKLSGTASHPKLSPSELGMNVDPALAQALAPPGETLPDESVVARSFASRHRRGLLVLITVSAVMVLGVVAALVFVLSGGQEDLPIGLGGTRQSDTSRPEDIVRRQLPPAPNETGSGTAHRPRYTQHTNQNPNPLPEEPDTGPGSKLDASEIEAMAAKYGEGTKRCYMRAQKGALGFEVADTKKIDVTLTVQKDGTVSDVQLSKHANNEFGQCLIARIKGWKFRESKGGTFRIALAFSAS